MSNFKQTNLNLISSCNNIVILNTDSIVKLVEDKKKLDKANNLLESIIMDIIESFKNNSKRNSIITKLKLIDPEIQENNLKNGNIEKKIKDKAISIVKKLYDKMKIISFKLERIESARKVNLSNQLTLLINAQGVKAAKL